MMYHHIGGVRHNHHRHHHHHHPPSYTESAIQSSSSSLPVLQNVQYTAWNSTLHCPHQPSHYRTQQPSQYLTQQLMPYSSNPSSQYLTQHHVQRSQPYFVSANVQPSAVCRVQPDTIAMQKVCYNIEMVYS